MFWISLNIFFKTLQFWKFYRLFWLSLTNAHKTRPLKNWEGNLAFPVTRNKLYILSYHLTFLFGFILPYLRRDGLSAKSRKGRESEKILAQDRDCKNGEDDVKRGRGLKKGGIIDSCNILWKICIFCLMHQTIVINQAFDKYHYCFKANILTSTSIYCWIV